MAAFRILRLNPALNMDKSSVPVLIPRNEQFTTNAGEIRVDEVLPSDAKKEEPPPCTFTLCRDIWLLPVRLEQIENRSTTRNGVINITFSVAPGTDFRTLDLNKLRFWLGNDDNYTRDQLYLWFCEYLQGADLTVGEQHLRRCGDVGVPVVLAAADDHHGRRGRYGRRRVVDGRRRNLGRVGHGAGRRRGGRKRALGSRAPMMLPQGPNQRWSLDFVSDALGCGRRFRILCVVDDFTRECLALVPDTSISGVRVARELDRIIAWRGRPDAVTAPSWRAGGASPQSPL